MAWQDIVNKIALLGTDLESRNRAWKQTAEKLSSLSTGSPGPSPGDPVGAQSPETAPPGSSLENAATPVVGRWKQSLGKWEQKESASREVADAPTPFAEQQEIDQDTDKILAAIKEVLDEVKSLKDGAAERYIGGSGHEVQPPSEKKPAPDKPKEKTSRRAPHGADVIRAAATIGL